MARKAKKKLHPIIQWPKTITYWIEGKTLYASIPFTWDLPIIDKMTKQRSMFFENIIVGGPAVKLMPNYFQDNSFVKIGLNYPGVLQKINPYATKTTTGCIRKCGFCAVPQMEGNINELNEWLDRPILIDNNLLAAKQPHFDKVIDRLKVWQWADFNQGLDSRLLTTYHAERLAEIKKPMIRLALDNVRYQDKWSVAFEKLIRAGIAKSHIRTYALCGYDSDPDESWERCEWIENHKIKVLPQWFHELNAMEKNLVTDKQTALGWNDFERRRIMQWFYKHKKAKA